MVRKIKMKLFYKVSEKELVTARNKIFIETCKPIIFEKGFEKSPFNSNWNGKDSLGGFTYNFSKIDNSLLHTLEIQISKGDKWIKCFLNIFKITPEIKSLEELKSKDGIQFKIPPNSLTEMRLVTESFKGMPLLNYRFMFNDHKLKTYYTKKGFERNLYKLRETLKNDILNIDYFIQYWYKLHKPFETNMNGELIGLESMTVNERLNHINYNEEFEKCLKTDKKRARYILKWIKVDDKSIKEILK